jgi:hypothetical protein
MNKIKIISLAFLALSLTGCWESESDKRIKKIKAKTEVVNHDYDKLNNSLNSNPPTNALVLKAYAIKLKVSNPEYSEIADKLERNGKKNGDKMLAFKDRIEGLEDFISRKLDLNAEITQQEYQTNSQETYSLMQGLNKESFNESLIDEINTLASLSGGSLKPVSTPEGSSESMTPGQALVGNPQYGRWETNSSGSSVWMWIAAYSMLNNNRPYYASSYYSRPRNSYYNDYGRNSYGSSREKSRSNKVYPQSKRAKPTKSYSKLQKNKSNFPGSNSKKSNFGSSKSKKTSSFFGSSQRDSGFRTSRGSSSWGGK